MTHDQHREIYGVLDAISKSLNRIARQLERRDSDAPAEVWHGWKVEDVNERLAQGWIITRYPEGTSAVYAMRRPRTAEGGEESGEHMRGQLHLEHEDCGMWELRGSPGTAATRIYPNAELLVADVVSPDPDDDDINAKQEANARRLAACWNACHDAGLSTKALEEGVVQKLVAACTVAHDYEAIPFEEFERKYGPMGLDDVLAMLSAALTEARGGGAGG